MTRKLTDINDYFQSDLKGVTKQESDLKEVPAYLEKDGDSP